MPVPAQFSFTRYLSAKKSVDDRALNRRVWETLSHHLPASSPRNPLLILEIGAGIGTMLERMLEGKLFRYAHYTAIDNQPENIDEARRRLYNYPAVHILDRSEGQKDALPVASEPQITARLQEGDVLKMIPLRPGERPCDLLVAHAFLDLIDLPSTLPGILSLLKPGGLFYFTLNFDGLTLFEPQVEPSLDELIQHLYHRTMDERLQDGHPSGDSRTGRHLFSQLKRCGAQILEAGASDWVIYPQDGSYPADEAYFLHFIIHTIHTALRGHPELDAPALTAWAQTRHAQIERSELIYIAHQIDFTGRYQP
ncbi:MAG TPA: class I SAM-dependent methyltransferase [Anaerolineales bacterium]|nr:class I SAM-dependent methyltransferase [Anaerolineales bacterium]